MNKAWFTFVVSLSFNLIIAQPTDSDGDGIPDQYEQVYGLTNGTDDSVTDSDNDGFSNACEVFYDVNQNMDQDGNINPQNLNTSIWQDNASSPPQGYDCNANAPGGGGGSGGSSGSSSSSCSDPLEVSLDYSTISASPDVVNTSSANDADRTIYFTVYVRNTNNQLYGCSANVSVQFPNYNVTLTEQSDGVYTGSLVIEQNAQFSQSASFAIDNNTSDNLIHITVRPNLLVEQKKELFLGFDGSSLWSGNELENT